MYLARSGALTTPYAQDTGTFIKTRKCKVAEGLRVVFTWRFPSPTSHKKMAPEPEVFHPAGLTNIDLRYSDGVL